MAACAVVTGATGGIGYFAAEGLARAGLRLVLTGRNEAKGEAALGRLRRALPQADATFALLDVGRLSAVADFAQAWQGPLDVLINNAGVMGYPSRRETADGFEAQFGINYLGHFALTLRLLPSLLKADRPRVVSVASLAHRSARFDFDDLQSKRHYNPRAAYAQSKLAMLVFAHELHRRSTTLGLKLASIAAHPGWAATDIVANGMGTGLLARLAGAGFALAAQSAAAGAEPLLFAALDPRAQPGGYYGPSLLGETRGPPGVAKVMPNAADPQAAERLWAESERLTGVSFASAVSG